MLFRALRAFLKEALLVFLCACVFCSRACYGIATILSVVQDMVAESSAAKIIIVGNGG